MPHTKPARALTSDVRSVEIYRKHARLAKECVPLEAAHNIV